MMSNKISKTINTVKYMTPRQWRYRLYYMARNKIKKRIPKKPEKKIAIFPLATFYHANVLNNAAIEIANNICNNIIPTISSINVGFNGDWDLFGEEYRLVSFRLNSFRWLLDLSDAYKITGDDEYIEKGFELIDDWINKNGEKISGDKWNAYVIADRIMNWIGFCSEYGRNTEKVNSAIFSQAQELKDSIEFQLGANHLLSEAKALVYAGIYLQNQDLSSYGKRVLISEAKVQFLEDGGHYERSVSYHVESLQQYFETYIALKICEDKEACEFVSIMELPFVFLNDMIGVDGRIPLFNDAAYDYPFFDATDFLSVAELIYSEPINGRKGIYYNRWFLIDKQNEKIDWIGNSFYKSTGYIHYKFLVGSEKYSFFMDVADCGPDENLGHAHADALNFLLCSENKQIFVDSGVFTYKPGKERDDCRSTKAHNTLEIDGKDNAEVWAAFRVAKRGHTKVIDYSSNENLFVKAYYDGYTKITNPPVKQYRSIVINDEAIELIDEIEGKGVHSVIARFHIGPSCQVVQDSPKSCIIDDSIIVESENELKIVECEVAGMFGIREQSKCIEIDFNGRNRLKTEIIIEKR